MGTVPFEHSHSGSVVSESDNAAPKTPVKGRRAIQRQPQADDLPWTVARCNRLLRSITSRVQILKKLSAINKAGQASRPGQNRNCPDEHEVIANRRNEPSIQLSSSDQTSCQCADPEWLPDGQKKHLSRKYVANTRSKRAAPVKESGTSGNKPNLRTPFIGRMLWTNHIGERQRSTADGVSNLARPVSRTHQINVKPNTTLEEANGNLINAFRSFLTSTAPKHPTFETGSRSLLSTCLRIVPEYIELDAQWADDADEDEDFDIGAETYSYLESLGGRKGWHGLRELVRAHGIQAVADAAESKLLSTGALNGLLRVCKECDAAEASQHILQSWCLRLETLTNAQLVRLVNHSLDAGLHSFLFRSLGRLLRRTGFDIALLCEQLEVRWALTSALAGECSQLAALEFLELFVASLNNSSDSSKDPIEHMRSGGDLLRYASIFITASAWKIHQNPEVSEHDRAELASLVQRLGTVTFRIHRSRRNANENINVNLLLDNIKPVLTSCLVLQVAVFKSSPAPERVEFGSFAELLAEQESLAPRVTSTDDTSRQGPEFICAVARSVAQAFPGEALDFLRDMAFGLLKASKHVSDSASNFLQKLAVDTAIDWAEYREDNESFQFVEDVERSVHEHAVSADTTPTPECCRRPKKYHWEDSLGEWIAVAPVESRTHARHATHARLDHLEEHSAPSAASSGESVRSTRRTRRTAKRGSRCKNSSVSDTEDELAPFATAKKRRLRSRPTGIHDKRDYSQRQLIPVILLPSRVETPSSNLDSLCCDGVGADELGL